MPNNDWDTKVRNLLINCDIQPDTVNKDNMKLIYKKCSDNLLSIGRESLIQGITQCRKASLYKEHIQHVFEGIPSPIVTSNILNNCKRKLIQLRLSNHKFGIETVSWLRPIVPRIERKCIVCNVLEDKLHVILICPLYATIRMHYLPEKY